MNMSRFLQFFVREHNEHIIEALIVLVLLSVLGYVIYTFYASTKEDPAKQQLQEIESALKRVLQSTEVKASAVSGAVVQGAAASAEGNEEFATLQKILEEREQELKGLRDEFEKVKAGAPVAAAGGGGGDTSALESKIKDLESKLMEYSIIEDDIANLSLYKEENTKLKNEIEKLKKDVASAATAVAAAPAAAPVVAPTPPAPSTPAAAADVAPAADDDLMAEFAAAVNAQKQTEAIPAPAPVKVAPPPAAPAVEEVSADDDLMAEFAAAVSAQKQTEAGGEKVVDDKVVKELETKLDEVREERAQFEKELEKKVIENNLVGDGNFQEVVKDPDINKMKSVLQEVSGEDANTDAVKAHSEEALGAETDTEKLLSEMDHLLTANHGDEPEDPTKKLIEEFESMSQEVKS